MDNVVLTSASQISPNSGVPLSSQTNPSVPSEPVVQALMTNPLEPSVEPTNVDGNFQAKMDVNYQAHDVALAAATAAGKSSNEHEPTNGFQLNQVHQMEIDDGYEQHPDKVKSCCPLLNTLFLTFAIVCFILVLCSMTYIIINREKFNAKDEIRTPTVFHKPYPYQINDPFVPLDVLNAPYFNLTQPQIDGIIVVLARRGAAIRNILVPEKGPQGVKRYRSIVLRGNNYFGVTRFGFDEDNNSMNLTNQLPLNYPFLNFYDEDWTMYGDASKPYRVRFQKGIVEVIYEFSSSNNSELMMKTVVSPGLNEEIIVDPTNNIYFNLRGYGDLSTHRLTLSSSMPINMKTGEKNEQNPLNQGQMGHQLNNVTNYFYKLDRAGIGKNYVATLTEEETKISMKIFADHAGITIDPSGMGVSNSNQTMPDINGIRLSPRQSPVYRSMSIYGPTLVVYPSQSIHTTWWQFEY